MAVRRAASDKFDGDMLSYQSMERPKLVSGDESGQNELQSLCND